MKRGLFCILVMLVTSCNWFVSPERVRVDEIMSHAHELYQKKNYIDAIDTLNKAVVILSKRDVPEELANCYNRLGLLYWKIRDTALSMNYYNRALEFAKVVSPYLQAKILTNMGNGFDEIGDFTNAYFYYTQVNYLNIAQNSSAYNFNLINLGNMYTEFKQYEKARECAKNALTYFKPVKDTESISRCYSIMIICDAEQKKPFEIDYMSINDEYISLNLCEIYLKQKDYTKCDSLAGILIKADAGDDFLAWAHYLYGVSQFKQMKYEKSLLSLGRAEKFTDSMDYTTLKDIIYLKVSNYSALHDIANLNKVRKEQFIIEAQIDGFDRKNQNELLMMQKEARYQYKNLENKLETLNKITFLSQFNFVVITGGLILILVLIYLYFSKRKPNSFVRFAQGIIKIILNKFFIH